ncbi:uncharacterized protein LOC119732987 [Patiria miniata]|uniref:Protein sleepless n=1 Tax=Patiria miniata TaxID=46514 RepID=A0A914AFI2_PATMI|nr:uncharacterized protein LOC119732987 [Patiria miniata]
MGKYFALLLLLLAVTSGGGALKCFTCHNVLSPFPDCENSRNWGIDHDGCSSENGLVALCAQVNGILSADYHHVHSGMKDVELDCMFFDQGNVPENKCYHGEDALTLIKDNTPWSMFPASIDVKSVTFHFEGSVCLCDTDLCNGDLPK